MSAIAAVSIRVVDHEMDAMARWYELSAKDSRLRRLEDDCRRLAVPPSDAAYTRNLNLVCARLAALVDGADLRTCQTYLRLAFDHESRRRSAR